MKIRLELLGPLRLPPGGRRFEGSFRRGTSLRAILRKALGYTQAEMRSLAVIRDGRPLHLDSRLTSDATLTVFLRMGGG